jgi:hypothetical protein
VIAKPLIPDEYNPFFFYPPHTYFVSENKIELIEIDLGLLPHYALSFLLQEFGLPTEVRINTLVEPFRGAFNFVLYVYYDGVGILAQYDVQGQLIDEKVYGCPQTDARTILILWQPEQSTTFEQIADRTILWNWYSDGSGIYPAQDIESISDLTTLDFYNKFDGSDPSACIESPVSFWPWLVQQ